MTGAPLATTAESIDVDRVVACDRRVAFVCPFDLDRLAGTPVRARLDVAAARRVARILAVSTGGRLAGVRAIPDVWTPRPDRGPRFRVVRWVRGVTAALREWRPDVVHAVGPYGILPALAYKAGRWRTRVVFEMHGVSFLEARNARLLPRALAGLADWLGLVAADRVIVMSHTQRDLVVGWPGVVENRIEVVWGPEDLDAVAHVEPPPAPPLRVGYLGKNNYWQGVDTVLAAARRLSDRDDLEFAIAGFPAEEARGPRPANVTFVGRVARTDVAAFLARCHVLVSPRIADRVTEGQYPQKLSTYLAAGRPIVASDANDQRLVVDAARCGVLFPGGDADALADAVAALAALPAARREELGRNARLFAERHLSLAALARRLGPLYGLGGGA